MLKSIADSNKMNRTLKTPSHFLRAAVLAGGLSIFAGSLAAQTPNYFPLETGNIWLFRSVTINSQAHSLASDFQTIRVQSKEKIDDKEYFAVSYFGRDLLLRLNSVTGEIVQYDRVSGSELPWLSLSLPVGGAFPTSLDGCTTEGRITSRSGMVAIPDGDPSDVVQVDFTGGCADAGVTRQFYAPNVGLIRTEESTFAGARIYRLVYYRAGTAIGAGSEVSFSMGLDSPPHFTGGLLGVRLSLRNASFEGLQLHFPSGQSYDFQILNSKREIVYTWSRDKIFAAVIRDEKLDSPGELAFGLSVSLDEFPPGHYIARGYLTTDPLQYTAEVGFDVVAPAR